MEPQVGVDIQKGDIKLAKTSLSKQVTSHGALCKQCEEAVAHCGSPDFYPGQEKEARVESGVWQRGG
jgi:hypothetical protein